MKNGLRALLLPVLTVVLLLAMAGVSRAATISGTVVNGSGKTGRIYLSVHWSGGGDTGYGVSIAAPGSFTINGVPSGNYRVKAFIDTQGTGIQHANDPAGVSNQIDVSSGTVPAGTITLSNPSPVAAQAPEVMAYPGSGGNFVLWDGHETNDGLAIADKYIISWSASPTGDPLAGSQEVADNDYGFFVHGGGTSSLYYQVTAVAGATTASTPWTQVSAASGTGSVTGKVHFPGVTATGPLFVALVDFSTDPPKFSVAVVNSPVSGGNYTIGNVPAGTYEVYAFLDLNNSGTYDVGDVGWRENDDFAPRVTVSTSLATAEDITLTGANATTLVATDHGKNQWGEWYNIILSVQSMQKQVVNVQVVSGPQIAAPVDVAGDGFKFDAWIYVSSRPTVGDSYEVKVTYADGTSEPVTREVTAVLDGFPTLQAPVGYIPYNPTPTFSWTTPSPAPAEYIYNIWVNDNNSGVWDVWGVPSSQTSMVYGSQGEVDQDELTDGTTYNWTINVIDRNGNRAQSQTTFTPTSAPVITGFSPAGGLAGTIVTIDGFNFDSTPANNTVKFNGTTATVSSATATRLIVAVPFGATSGSISVTSGGKTGSSDQGFVVAPSISLTSTVTDINVSPLSGALVEMVDNPSVKTTTAANGGFTLTGLPYNAGFQLRITRAGYLPVYTEYFYSNQNLTVSPYTLLTASDLTLSPGKSAIFARVLDGQDYVTPVSGATATAASYNAQYTVSYYNSATGDFTGTATDASGIIRVLDVAPYDYVDISVSKSGWTFWQKGVSVPAGAVAEIGIIGNPPSPPSLTGFSPSTGKVGDLVTIYGYNFISSNSLENVVKFNGTTAQVVGGSSSNLWVYLPSGATTGQITVTTEGGTASSYSNFTVQYTLSSTLVGSGGGSVNSIPSGIACTGGTCSAPFDYDSSITVTAIPDSGSIFAGWSDACGGTGDCSVTMTGDKGVTATFDLAPLVRIGGSSYATLQAAYNAAAIGNVIQAQALDFIESLTLDRNVAVTLKGGYDSVFTANNSYSVLKGVLTIGQGALTVERVIIQ